MAKIHYTLEPVKYYNRFKGEVKELQIINAANVEINVQKWAIQRAVINCILQTYYYISIFMDKNYCHCSHFPTSFLRSCKMSLVKDKQGRILLWGHTIPKAFQFL